MTIRSDRVAVPSLRPLVAAALVVIGGGFVTVAGLLLALVGTVLAAVFGFSSWLFLVGAIVGLLTIGVGGLLLVFPSARKALGALAMVLAVLSIPFAFGGFVVGFLLVFVGGAVAIAGRGGRLLRAAAASGNRAPPWG